MKDYLSSDWAKLPPIAQRYLLRIEEEHEPLEDYLAYVDLLLSPDNIRPNISKTLEELSHFIILPETTNNARIAKGYKILKDFLETKTPLLKKEKAAIIIYGSMRYGDPQNLDYDLDVMVNGPIRESAISALHHQWNDELGKLWIHIGSQGHIVVASMSDLETFAHAFYTNNLYMVDVLAPLIDTHIDAASTLLSGHTEFSPNKDAVTLYKNRVMRLATEVPMIGAGIAVSLQKALAIRYERRKS